MADTTTPNYELVLIQVGGSRDTWGDKVNANMALIDAELDKISDDVADFVSALAAKLPASSYTAEDVLAKVQVALGAAPVKRSGDVMSGSLTVQGVVDGATPAVGSTGGIRCRAGNDGAAIFQAVTDGGTGELGRLTFRPGLVELYVGNVKVMDINDAGNMRIKGTLAQSVAL